jgi:hypothetical protein
MGIYRRSDLRYALSHLEGELMEREAVLAIAYERGHERGTNEAMLGFDRNDSPLSGEWAGESIPELLGDLLASNDEFLFDEVCERYEYGHYIGWTDEFVRRLVQTAEPL